MRLKFLGSQKIAQSKELLHHQKYEVFSLCESKLDGKITTSVVHTTNVEKNTLKPSWDKFTISLRTLCNGDIERPIQFDVYDWDNDSENDLIG